MHPSPALVPRLSALARASAKPKSVRLAVEHVETHAPPFLRTPQHTLHPHPLAPHAHPTHPFRQPRKFLFFSLNRRSEPLPAPMIEWNDHLSMV